MIYNHSNKFREVYIGLDQNFDWLIFQTNLCLDTVGYKDYHLNYNYFLKLNFKIFQAQLLNYIHME